MTHQLRLFPKITRANGKEYIYARDSNDCGWNFARKQGSEDLFYNRFAGLPRHPKTRYGPGEYVDEYGQIVEREGASKDHQLVVQLGGKKELAIAQKIVEEKHYLRRQVHPQARPMVYIIEHRRTIAGLIMVSIPHATRNRGWWGYPGTPTQWQVIDLCRIWIDPIFQPGNAYCYPGVVPGFTDRNDIFRSTTPTWAMQQVLKRVQIDRVSLWPPVYPDEPYHIRLAISYHDPEFHKGTIYRMMGWQPMYQDAAGNPKPGSSGKFGWCWPLPEPDWSWDQIEIRQPRTMRIPFEIQAI